MFWNKAKKVKTKMIYPTDFQNGMVLLIDGESFEIMEFQIIKFGKVVPHAVTKLRDLSRGGFFVKSFELSKQVEVLQNE